MIGKRSLNKAFSTQGEKRLYFFNETVQQELLEEGNIKSIKLYIYIERQKWFSKFLGFVQDLGGFDSLNLQTLSISSEVFFENKINVNIFHNLMEYSTKYFEVIIFEKKLENLTTSNLVSNRTNIANHQSDKKYNVSSPFESTKNFPFLEVLNDLDENFKLRRLNLRFSYLGRDLSKFKHSYAFKSDVKHLHLLPTTPQAIPDLFSFLFYLYILHKNLKLTLSFSEIYKNNISFLHNLSKFSEVYFNFDKNLLKCSSNGGNFWIQNSELKYILNGDYYIMYFNELWFTSTCDHWEEDFVTYQDQILFMWGSEDFYITQLDGAYIEKGDKNEFLSNFRSVVKSNLDNSETMLISNKSLNLRAEIKNKNDISLLTKLEHKILSNLSIVLDDSIQDFEDYLDLVKTFVKENRKGVFDTLEIKLSNPVKDWFEGIPFQKYSFLNVSFNKITLDFSKSIINFSTVYVDVVRNLLEEGISFLQKSNVIKILNGKKNTFLVPKDILKERQERMKIN